MATVGHLRAALAEPVIDDELRARIVYRLTQALAHTDQVAQAAAVAAEEARRATHSRTRLRMQADHFQWSSCRTDEPDSRARTRRLARLAARLPGRNLEERYILGLRSWDALLCGEPRSTVLEYAEKALRGGLSWTEENRGFEVPVSVALTFMYCDQPRRAEELFTRGIAECEAKGWRGSHLALGQTLLGYIRYRRGCLAGVEDLVREGLHIAERVREAVPAQWFAIGILIQILLARGRTAEARQVAERTATARSSRAPWSTPTPARCTPNCSWRRDETRRRRGCCPLSVSGWSPRPGAIRPGAPGSSTWRPPSPPGPPSARRAWPRRPSSGPGTSARPSVIGQALHLEAEVTGGAAALDPHAEAVAQLERSPAPYELARALVGHGAALLRGARVQEAADRLYRGLEVPVHCGAEGVATRARAELSAAGLPSLPLRYAQSDTLTAQERTAAELTAQGHPASVVAKELHLTEQGVRQLLSSTYRKIGTDAAGLAQALTTFPRP
ncbi:helix-turn-helix transcriptional regulator [Streptomyces sp. NPDC001796]|uniref:helix-turn-helix transcriptional regulator n=1 Tax=Streptomyces sp. NPDC001796 TaxID=3364609 RepID=UPI00368A6E9D